MIDARDTYRKVNSTINDFSPDQLEGLTAIIRSYRGENVNFRKNEWLNKTFPNSKYEDTESLCKIVSIDKVIENDYSLNPGRYVGFSIKIDNEFDYQERMSELHGELTKLNKESNVLVQAIQKLKL